MSMSSVRVSKKPFCKVCKDMGKTEKEYTSHCVKSKTGQILCPILLSNVCKHCFKKGHMMSYCPNVKTTSKKTTTTTTTNKEIQKNSNNKNSFTVLAEDYVIDKNKKEELFPPLGLVKKSSTTTTMNYLEKAKMIPIEKPILKKKNIIVSNTTTIQWSDELSSVEYDGDEYSEYDSLTYSDFEEDME